MPIYEYLCRDCGHHFEALVRGAQATACPACHSAALDQQFSVFAVGGKSQRAAAREPAAPCGTCADPRGPGSCSLN